MSLTCLLLPHHGLRASAIQVLAMPHTHLRLALAWTWRGPDGGLRRAVVSAFTGGVRNSGWHIWHGKWWAVQCAACIGPFNLGVHIDIRTRRRADGLRYGPYADFHLPFSIVSFGVNPVYSGELELMVSSSRGGLP